MEMVIVVAIVGILAALVVPSFSRSKELGDLRAATRKLMGTIQRARTLAATGKNDNYPTWNPTDRVVHAGILFAPDGYQLFVDRDRIRDGDEITIEVVDFDDSTASEYAPTVVVVAPPPATEIRFAKNGTIVGGLDNTLILRDTPSGIEQTVQLSLGGSARLR